jgi:hypothetical protein
MKAQTEAGRQYGAILSALETVLFLVIVAEF